MWLVVEFDGFPSSWYCVLIGGGSFSPIKIVMLADLLVLADDARESTTSLLFVSCGSTIEQTFFPCKRILTLIDHMA